MAIKLFEHNRQAYEAAVAMLSKKRKAAIIHPTGTGKSFIGFQLCKDNTDKFICWLSPSEYIFKTQLENLAAVSDGYQPENIKFFTYAKLMNMTSEEISEIQPDYIILDEFHRCGAKYWGMGVQRLLGIFPDAFVLGLSATAIRYLDNQRDMADELFDGNIASEMTLGEAIVSGILNPPKYVLSIYSYSKDFEKYEKRVASAKSKAVRDEATLYLDALKRTLENAEGLDLIFDRHMTDRHGKYIVFTPNYESMHDYMELSKDWFNKVDKDAHIYSVYSDDPLASKSFRAFKTDNSNHLKLLYCIDALNEGVHVEDVSGVILLRPTVSPIIYKQQIGRALSASNSKEPVIFDVVNNIENLYSIDSIKEEMRNAIFYYRSHGEDKKIVNESFEIIDKLAKCKEIFEQLEGTLTSSWDVMYAVAEKYYHANGSLDPPKRFITEDGYALGSWLNTQRRVRSGKIYGILTDEQIEKLDKIGMRWDSVKDITWNKYYSAAFAFYQTHHSLDVNARFVTDDGVRLGAWLAQLRTSRKIGMNSSYLTSEHIAQLDALGMVWDVYDYVYGNLDCKSDYVTPNGIKLGSWLGNLRSQYKKNPKFLTDKQFNMLNAIGMRWGNKYDLQWDEAYDELCEYYRIHKNVSIPAAYRTEKGTLLGRWVRRQADVYARGKLSSERIEKLKKVGFVFVFETVDAWEEKFQLAKAYSDEHQGNLNVPVNYIVNGVWLNKWLNEQKLIGEGKRKKKLTPEQYKKLESIGLVFGRMHADNIWQERFEEAKKYFDSHGDLNVPAKYMDDLGKDLHRWIEKQKKKYRAWQLSDERIKLLSSIGMTFDTNDSYEEGYVHAQDYFNKNGDLVVPGNYVCDDGFKLYQWLKNRRVLKKSLTEQQIKQLDELGMIWDVHENQWMQMYSSAVCY